MGRRHRTVMNLFKAETAGNATSAAVQSERTYVMTDPSRIVSKASRTHNGILTSDTTTAIIETFLRARGPASESEIEAIVRAGEEAATSLACFQMALRGELIAEVKGGSLVFRKAGEPSTHLEPTTDVLRRMVAEVSR